MNAATKAILKEITPVDPAEEPVMRARRELLLGMDATIDTGCRQLARLESLEAESEELKRAFQMKLQRADEPDAANDIEKAAEDLRITMWAYTHNFEEAKRCKNNLKEVRDRALKTLQEYEQYRQAVADLDHIPGFDEEPKAADENDANKDDPAAPGVSNISSDEITALPA